MDAKGGLESAISWIVDRLKSAAINVSFYPHVMRVGHRSLGTYIAGRKGPGCSGTDPYVYRKPTAASLAFRMIARTASEQEFNELASKVQAVYDLDDVSLQFQNPSAHGPGREVKKELKPEFREQFEALQKREEERRQTINAHIAALKKLGVKDTGKIDVSAGEIAPSEWFTETVVLDWSQCWTPNILCDEKSAVWQALDKAGLIEANVPDWYRLGHW
jgi:hypothetical protein